MGVRDFNDGNFLWPTSVAQVCDIVRAVAAAGGKLRARGSQHSDFAAVYTDAFDPVSGPQPNATGDAKGNGVTNLVLDKLTGVKETDREISFEAGHHLGVDPYGRGNARDPRCSVAWHLNHRGLALPALGGISHQAIAGFLSTGSAGGSTHHDPADAVIWIKLVDGTGTLRKLERGDPDFDAALVSLGLFGILVEVAFNKDPDRGPVLPRRYDIRMTSRVCRLSDWKEDGKPFDPYARGALQGFFQKHEYARVLWWPQPGVDKVQIWTAHREDHNPKIKRKHYRNMTWWQQRLAGFIYRHVLGTGIDPALDPSAPPVLASPQAATLRERLVAFLINAFITDEDEEHLYDDWHVGLPHDNQIDDEKMPVIFTELWIKLPRAHEVMQELRKLYDGLRLKATGTLCVELYPARRRPAWLSPAHGEDDDVIRVDPFVFWIDDGTRELAVQHFFPLYWNALAKFDFRNHWGKVLDPSPAAVQQRHRAFPLLAKFKELRKQYDPKDLFVSRYWRDRLDL